MVKVLGAANGKLARALGAVVGAEQVPGVSVFDDRRIVGVLDVAFELEDVGSVVCAGELGSERKKRQSEKEVKHTNHDDVRSGGVVRGAA